MSSARRSQFQVLGGQFQVLLTPCTRPWWRCVSTDAVVVEQGGAVVGRLVLLLPQAELLTGQSLMLRRPLQTNRLVLLYMNGLLLI